MLTRIVQREVPLAMSHVETICLMMDEVVQSSEVACERVVRVVSEVNETAVLARMVQQKQFDTYGRLLKVTIFLDVVDHAVYDQLRTKVPSFAPSPFLHAMP